MVEGVLDFVRNHPINPPVANPGTLPRPGKVNGSLTAGGQVSRGGVVEMSSFPVHPMRFRRYSG